MSTAVTDAAEKCKALLLEMQEARRMRELAEREASEVEREQRSLAKSARLDALFRDLRHLEEGVDAIRESRPMSDAGPAKGKLGSDRDGWLL
ncbi:hypothetical protein D9615_002800 [Tricholomella constricta]|uniref:Uncharacterized protein n=1 Tax=Tricholomella constricta TaxID=117010 RepID=A0A8H5HG03_9AGAR|nr:hypothetical protein D9615_002800 [Tricholomella constricta]